MPTALIAIESPPRRIARAWPYRSESGPITSPSAPASRMLTAGTWPRSGTPTLRSAAMRGNSGLKARWCRRLTKLTMTSAPTIRPLEPSAVMAAVCRLHSCTGAGYVECRGPATVDRVGLARPEGAALGESLGDAKHVSRPRRPALHHVGPPPGRRWLPAERYRPERLERRDPEDRVPRADHGRLGPDLARAGAGRYRPVGRPAVVGDAEERHVELPAA